MISTCKLITYSDSPQHDYESRNFARFTRAVVDLKCATASYLIWPLLAKDRLNGAVAGVAQ
jgi:hypothetical protein